MRPNYIFLLDNIWIIGNHNLPFSLTIYFKRAFRTCHEFQMGTTDGVLAQSFLKLTRQIHQVLKKTGTSNYMLSRVAVSIIFNKYYVTYQ